MTMNSYTNPKNGKTVIGLILAVLLLALAGDSAPAPIAAQTPVISWAQTSMAVPPAGFSTLDKAELDKARSKWESKNIQAYEIDVHEIVRGGWETSDNLYTLRVRDGHVETVSAKSVDASRTVLPFRSEYSGNYAIDSQFKILDDALKTYYAKARFDVEYYIQFDQTFGYPSEIISIPDCYDCNIITAIFSNLKVLDSK